jgi:Flp pilus assembly protein TadD
LFSVLFSHYVKHGVMKDRVARYMARAKADENDDVGALVAGVLLHYEKQFARSNVLVERAAPTFPEEPRVYIYQAMNHFNLGDREKAEAFIAQAEALAAPDPDVYYCVGEIYRDSDRAKALEALEVYWHMTAVSGGDISEKQARVRGMMRAIATCQRDNTPAPCPGPFEHSFGSATPAAAP